MKSPVVAREVAEADVNEWLEKKKIFQSTIDTAKDAVEIITEALMMGVLVYGDPEKPDADKQFKHILLHPLEGGVTELTYKNRLNDKMLQPYLKGIDTKNIDDRINATIAALTAQARGVIAGLDSVDKRICNAIATFFF